MKRKYWTKIFAAAFILCLLCMLTGCNWNRKYPKEGIWYCKEHQIQISYEPPEYESYVMVENEKVRCEVTRERRDTRMYLFCIEENNAYFEYREEVFSGELIYLDDEKFILRGDDGTKYVFVRQG